MEEKKYEAGRVEISSAEYRDLVTEAVKAREEASQCRSEKWKLESENKKLQTELEETKKELVAIRDSFKSLQPPYINCNHPDYQAYLASTVQNVAEVKTNG